MAPQVSGRPAPRTRARRGCRSRRSAPGRGRTETIASCRIAAPATITSPRPGGIAGRASRSARGIRASRSSDRGRRRRAVSHEPWIRSGSSRSSPRASACTVDRGARDRHERACARRPRRSRSRAPPRSRRGARRAHPAAAGRRAGGARSSGPTPSAPRRPRRRRPSAPPATNSVEPPPMSITANGPVSSGSRARDPPRERERRLALAVDDLGAGARSPARPAPTNASRFAASRTALVAPTTIRVAPSARARRAYLVSTASTRASASGSSRPLASTPCPSRVITRSRASSTGGSPAASTNSRVEFVPWSIAAATISRGASPGWIGSTRSATHRPTGSSPPARWFA